jgi:hypothetical protein
MAEPTTSLRDALESAIETAPAPELSAAPAPAPKPESVSEPVSVDAAQAAPNLEERAPDLNALAEGEPARDDQGKFAKPERAEIKPGPKAEPKQQGERAPAAWKPVAREHWASLPEDVKAEVSRREIEVQRTLQETAEARKYAEAVNKAFAPYEAYIRAENANPLQVIDNLMGTAVRLRTATAPELATMMAGLVKQFGTGRFGQPFIEMLDGALAGEMPQADQTQYQLQQAIQQQLAPVQQFMTQFQQAQVMQQQRAAEQAQSEVTTFLSKTEFGDDVREEMADLLEVAQRRGQELSLQDAYRQACLLNPNVKAVLQKRAQARGAMQQNQVVQRAKSAAVSVPSAGPGMGAPRTQPDDIRGAIEAAIAMNGR